MPNTFKHKGGSTIAGHSSKWAERNRPETSHNAGLGGRGSRNQGTGVQGKANTLPSEGTDTSKMSAQDKLKYFRSLGLLDPEPEQVQKNFEIKDLVQGLSTTFKQSPQYITAITNELKGLPKRELMYIAEEAYRALEQALQKTTEPRALSSYVLKQIKKAKE